MEQQAKLAKLRQFSSDTLLQSAVYEVLSDTFLKKKSGEDVQMKAARFVAIELLQEAWPELTKYTLENKSGQEASGNVGL